MHMQIKVERKEGKRREQASQQCLAERSSSVTEIQARRLYKLGRESTANESVASRACWA